MRKRSPRLKPEQAIEIRRLYRDGMPIKEIAYHFGLTSPAIHYIVTGRNHKKTGDGYVHLYLANEVVCDMFIGNLTNVDHTSNLDNVTCPDCLKIARLVRAMTKDYIKQLWRDMEQDDDNE